MSRIAQNTSTQTAAMERQAVSLNTFLVLGKHRIASLAAMSAAAGYVLSAGRLDWGLLAAIGGTFLLACASGALNQWQETDVDARMKRTCGRPLPMGTITPLTALIFSSMACALGTSILLIGANPLAAGLGLLAMASYNLLYTPLKRVTPWAALPGSIVGAIPPLLGWAAAGGSIFEPAALSIAVYFFIWQVPHFWLLLLYFGSDYQRSGLPCLLNVLGERKLARATWVGIVLTALAAGAGIWLAGGINAIWAGLSLAAASAWLVWSSRSLIHGNELKAGSVKKSFISINIFALVVLIVLSTGALF